MLGPGEMSEPNAPTGRDDSAAPNFIFDIIKGDVASGKNEQRLQTRFPPEPNGYLHIGHAKAICVNFEGAALASYGHCNLRFDDTNPEAEDDEYVRSILEDVRWLGFDPGERVYFTSSYFERLYDCAVSLVKKGLAYIDSQSPEEIRERRGNYHRLGTNSPYRERSVAENLSLLSDMRAGKFEEGACVLRAKIDMEHKDILLRDPLIYRIRKAEHHRTGKAWCIYPMYDFAHPLSDAFEGVTHSLCSLEFESHRPLYDWFVENVDGFDPVPRQIEFAKLAITYIVLSKRRLKRLVDEGYVDGWDDPRMPTLAGMRRRGYMPESLRAFCERVGVAKRDSLVDLALFEHRVREDLNAHANRTMAVLRPLRVVIENFPEDAQETFSVPLHPEYEDRGTRKVALSRVLYVEQEDYQEKPQKKWFRLAPGKEVRLRGACFITVKDAIYEDGVLVELRVTWDPESKGGSTADGRRVKGTIHWISERDARRATVRLYDRLFSDENPVAHEDRDFVEFVNPNSLEVCEQALVHRGLVEASAGLRVQFERLGYFCVDKDSSADAPLFNRTISLRDSWAKQATKD
jgi:glutaminyl-tRNA synthetase